jgi:hypothetical protein
MGRSMRRTAVLFVSLAFLCVTVSTAASALTPQRRAERASGYVAAHQSDNGSFPAFSPIGSTADAVMAFVAAGKGETSVDGAIGYLRRQTVRDNVDTIGLKAKVALAVEAVGLNAANFGGHSLLGEITETQRLTGRFGNASVLEQALASLAITAATGEYDADAITWLVRAQCPDGGWQFDRPHASTEGRHCGDASDPDDSFLSDTNTTAYALMAVEPSGLGDYDHNPFAFLTMIRDASAAPSGGGWGYTWGFTTTDANSTALVIQAYAAAERPVPDGSLTALRRLQYRCGAFAFSWTDDGRRTGPDVGASIGAIPGVLREPLPVVGDVTGEPSARTCDTPA